MNPSTTYVIAAEVLGSLALARPVATFAARRVLAQPVGVAIGAERSVLGAVLANPDNYETVAVMTSEDFYDEGHQRLWEHVVTAVAAGGLDDLRTTDPELVERLRELGAAEKLDRKALIRAGERVVTAAGDRGDLAGGGAVRVSNDPEYPLVREYQPPSWWRTFAVAVTMALLLVGSSLLTELLGRGRAETTLDLVALAIVIVTGAVVSLVDIDTMYLDGPVFWWGALGAWLLTGFGALTNGGSGRVVAGILVVLGTAGLFEGANLIYRAVRGFSGMGFGDTLILIVTAGVPTVITGSWIVGGYSVIGGLLCGVVGWAATWVRGIAGWGPRVTRTTPFAFGPYLEVGWLLSWWWLLAIHYPGVL